MLTYDYEFFTEEKGLREILADFKAKGLEVKEVQADNQQRRILGYQTKTATITLSTGQVVTLTAKAEGNIYRITLNGRVLPIKNYHDLDKTIGEVVDLVKAGEAAFLKQQARRDAMIAKVAYTKVKPVNTTVSHQIEAAKSKMEILTSQANDIDTQISEKAEAVATLKAAVDGLNARIAEQAKKRDDLRNQVTAIAKELGIDVILESAEYESADDDRLTTEEIGGLVKAYETCEPEMTGRVSAIYDDSCDRVNVNYVTESAGSKTIARLTTQKARKIITEAAETYGFDGDKETIADVGKQYHKEGDNIDFNLEAAGSAGNESQLNHPDAKQTDEEAKRLAGGGAPVTEDSDVNAQAEQNEKMKKEAEDRQRSIYERATEEKDEALQSKDPNALANLDNKAVKSTAIMESISNEKIDEYEFSFDRRRGGDGKPETWASVKTPDGKYISLGDPWNSITVPKSELVSLAKKKLEKYAPKSTAIMERAEDSVLVDDPHKALAALRSPGNNDFTYPAGSAPNPVATYDEKVGIGGEKIMRENRTGNVEKNLDYNRFADGSGNTVVQSGSSEKDAPKDAAPPVKNIAPDKTPAPTETIQPTIAAPGTEDSVVLGPDGKPVKQPVLNTAITEDAAHPGMNGYICMYKGKKIEIWAKTSYEAQQKAAIQFKARKSYDVIVYLAERSDGTEVTQVITEAAGPAGRFVYIVDLNERGEYKAHVEGQNGKEVFEIGTENGDDLTDIIADGFMKNGKDMAGLTEHLIEIGIIGKGSTIRYVG